MKRFKLFNHPIFNVITFLGFLFLTAPITAAEEKVFDANPVVAELENVPVKLEDLRNKKIYDLSLQLYQQLQERLIVHTLEKLEKKHKEINSKPEISVTEEQILAIYEGNNLKARGSLDQFRPQIRQFLKAQLRQEMLLNQYGLAMEKGWVKTYLAPPSDFTQEAPIKTAYIRGNPKAKVMILEFSDYQCPYCSRIQPTIQKLIKKYDQDIAFGYRHFPLGFHTEADEAAIAVVKQGIEVGGTFHILQEIYGLSGSRRDKTAGDDIKELQAESECVVCLTDAKDTSLMPCRHLCVCQQCGKDLVERKMKCPVCREPVTELLTLTGQ